MSVIARGWRAGRGFAHWWAVALVVVTACGCDGITKPETHDSVAVVGTPGAVAGWVQQVNGGGTGHLPNGLIQQVHVQAQGWADGSARGSVAISARVPPGQNSLPFDVNFGWTADIDCLTVSGGLAWMSGTVSSTRNQAFPGPLPVAIGDPVMAVVRDKNADPSLPPGFFSPAAVFGTTDCRDTPDVPPLAEGIVLHGVFSIH